MNCVSCDICVYHLGLCVCFPWGIPQLQSDWSLSCDHGLDYASENNNNTTQLFVRKEPASLQANPLFPTSMTAATAAAAGISFQHLFVCKRLACRQIPCVPPR